MVLAQTDQDCRFLWREEISIFGLTVPYSAHCL